MESNTEGYGVQANSSCPVVTEGIQMAALSSRFFVMCMVKYKSAFHVDLLEHIVYANCFYRLTYFLFKVCSTLQVC